MPTNPRMDFSKIFKAMTRIFKAASEIMRDLSDAIDNHSVGDRDRGTVRRSC